MQYQLTYFEERNETGSSLEGQREMDLQTSSSEFKGDAIVEEMETSIIM